MPVGFSFLYSWPCSVVEPEQHMVRKRLENLTCFLWSLELKIWWLDLNWKTVEQTQRSLEAATSITQILVGQKQGGGRQYVVTGFSSFAESNLTRDDLKDHCLKGLSLGQGHNTRKEMESAVRAANEEESWCVSQRMNAMSVNCKRKAP